jgi:hypothetical protein
MREFKADSHDGDLLGLVPSDPVASEGFDAQWINLGRKPKSEEIDYRTTSDEMILDGKAILKNGTKIYWLAPGLAR